MTTERAAGPELRKLINLSKNTPLNFAFCIGNKNDDVLLIDRRAKPEALERDAKKMSSGVKTVCGTLGFADQALRLTCAAPLPGVAKRIKKYLKAEKLDFKVALAGPDGAVLDEGEADEEAAAAPEPAQVRPAPASPAAAPVPPELAARLAALMQTGTAAGGKAAALATNGGGLVQKQLDAGDVDKAARTLGQMEAKLKQMTADAPAKPAAAPPDLKAARVKWSGARKALSADVQALIQGISTATQGVPGFEAAGDKARKLAHHFKPFDARLGAALAELEAAPPGPQRDKLRRAAERLVRDHATTLDSPFFRAVDDSGFAKTAIRARTMRSLQEVNAALKA